MCNLSEDVMERAIEKATLASIKSVMETRGFTIEQAMDALRVPGDDRPKYTELIQKQRTSRAYSRGLLTLESEVLQMCNLSEDVMERAIEKATLASIKSVMETRGFTIEQAMDALELPDDERPKYTELLQKQ